MCFSKAPGPLQRQSGFQGYFAVVFYVIPQGWFVFLSEPVDYGTGIGDFQHCNFLSATL